jgi:exopolysaccharide biosynthesis protein
MPLRLELRPHPNLRPPGAEGSVRLAEVRERVARVLDAGVSVAAHADSVEGTIARFSGARHPRSAVGFSPDSATLYLVAVDGRQEASAGATLEELATILRDLGAHHALNLDGGGSTPLVVGGALANVPSDSSGERPVGNVIAVTRGRPGSAR